MPENGPQSSPAREQLLALLGKMSSEAEKVKAQLNSLKGQPKLADDVLKICSGCIACGGCIYSV